VPPKRSTQRGRAAASEGAPAATAAPATTDYFATDKRPVILFDGVCNLWVQPAAVLRHGRL
jgi:hypothetical protein